MNACRDDVSRPGSAEFRKEKKRKKNLKKRTLLGILRRLLDSVSVSAIVEILEGLPGLSEKESVL